MAMVLDSESPSQVEYELSGDLRQIVLAGNAKFTVRNEQTGRRLTFRIQRCKDREDLFFVGVMTSDNNEHGYTYLGCVREGFYAHGRKSPLPQDSLYAKVFEWFWRHASALPASVRVYHAGACLRCGRPLTVPESIERGFGPECWGLSSSC